MFSCYAVLNCDQDICQLGAKLFAEESFLLGIDWSLTSRCNASSDRFVFPLLCGTQWSMYMPVTGAKVSAEESFLLVIDWSLTSRCNASKWSFSVSFSVLFFTVIKVQYMPVNCEALCWGILSVRHWFLTLTSRCNAWNDQFCFFFLGQW